MSIESKMGANNFEEKKDSIEDGWVEGMNDEGFQNRYIGYIKEEKKGIEIKEEDSSILISDFKTEKSTRRKLAILEKISELDIIGDEILNFIEQFSNDLITENKKISNEDGDYASFFEDGSDSDDSIMRPFVAYLIEILEKTKGTECQKRGGEILMNLLKNWNDFEVNYFYDFIGELNDWDEKSQAKESLVEAEYSTMHSEFGIDENIDNFDEGIKRLLNLNTDFLPNKNEIINLIGEVGDKESIDFLLEEIIKGKRSAHNNEVATALIKIDSEYAKEKLIELANNKDEIIKVNSIMILYRIQFGKLAENGRLEIDNKEDIVCRKFHEIIEQTELNREELENLFKNKKEISDEEIDKIIQNLISKAGQMLVAFSEKIGSDDKMDENDLIKELENYKAGLILTASIYKGIDKKNEMSPEDLEGVLFEQKTADNLFEEEIEQMKEIYSKNYEGRPSFRDKLIKGFVDILKKQGNDITLYMYKKDGEVIAFNRFDKLEEGKKYFGSFNVNSIIQDSSIGKALFKTSIEKESSGNEIEATCDAWTAASSMYIEEGKFTVQEFVKDFDGETEIPAFVIKKENNKKYYYPSLNKKDIEEKYNKNFKGNRFDENAEKIILKFKRNSPELSETSERLINEGKYVMTRCFCSDKSYKEFYCAFERGES